MHIFKHRKILAYKIKEETKMQQQRKIRKAIRDVKEPTACKRHNQMQQQRKIRKAIQFRNQSVVYYLLFGVLLYGFALCACVNVDLHDTSNKEHTSLNRSIQAFATPVDKTDEGNNKYQTKIVAKNLKIPWTMDFAPDGRIFFTEREGDLRVMTPNGTLLKEPIASFKVGGGEGGLLGMELDPNFEDDHHIYLYYTYSESVFSSYNRVVRFTEHNNQLLNEKVLLDRIPAAAIHDGGRIAFGPDGKLYITTGDAANAPTAQNIESLSGKILRINPDGTIPQDNPFGADSPVYSFGHRNPQGLDWDPDTKKLVISEHGPSGDRGAFAHDEVNVVEPGKNYGWPEIIGDGNNAKYVDPIIHTGDITWAPSGATFYTGDRYPDLKNKYLIATLRGVHLRVLNLDLENSTVLSSKSLFTGEFGRLRDVVQGPDDYLYLLTSNRDGRGSPVQEDDRIIKLIPKSHMTKHTITENGKSIDVVTKSTRQDVIDDVQITLDKEQKTLGFAFNEFSVLDKTDAGPTVKTTFSKELLGGPYEITLIDEKQDETNHIVTQEFVKLVQNSTHSTILIRNLVSDTELHQSNNVTEYSKVNVRGSTVIPEFDSYSTIMLVAGIVGVLLFMVLIRSRNGSLFVQTNFMSDKNNSSR